MAGRMECPTRDDLHVQPPPTPRPPPSACIDPTSKHERAQLWGPQARSSMFGPSPLQPRHCLKGRGAHRYSCSYIHHWHTAWPWPRPLHHTLAEPCCDIWLRSAMMAACCLACWMPPWPRKNRKTWMEGGAGRGEVGWHVSVRWSGQGRKRHGNGGNAGQSGWLHVRSHDLRCLPCCKMHSKTAIHGPRRN